MVPWSGCRVALSRMTFLLLPFPQPPLPSLHPPSPSNYDAREGSSTRNRINSAFTDHLKSLNRKLESTRDSGTRGSYPPVIILSGTTQIMEFLEKQLPNIKQDDGGSGAR